MYLHKFVIRYKDDYTQTIFKFCRYYKKTKLYKNCIRLLENDIIESFSVYNN